MPSTIKQTMIEGLRAAGVNGNIELTTPPKSAMGDFAFPVFNYAKELMKNPVEVAKDIKNILDNKVLNSAEFRGGIIERVESFGPYVNFFLKNGTLVEQLVGTVLKNKKMFGGQEKKQEKVMVEYSQPNTHKEFHIGHLRNVCIGSAMVNIFKFNGYKTIGANYIGDIGAHVAKCLWYIESYKKDQLGKVVNSGKWLGQMYAEASAKIEAEPELKREVAEVQQKLEGGDAYFIKLWKQTKKWSMRGFMEIYGLLGVKFDEWFFESEVEKPGKKMVEDLLKNGIAKSGDGGATIVDLTAYGLDIFLILKSDGTSLYATKDLALADFKFKKFKIDKSVYMTDNRQRHYFLQLFKTLELMGWKKDAIFLGYDFVTLPEGAMASRKGNVVLFMDLYNDVKNSVEIATKERHVDWKDSKIASTVQKIALAAIKFEILKHPIDKVIVFNKEEALSFEGFTGPYVLYAVARINSLLRKGKQNKLKPGKDFKLLVKPEEKSLALKMEEFHEVVTKALTEYNPAVVARYAFDLAQVFNDFYNKCGILNEPNKKLGAARLALCAASKQVLTNTLSLLAIDVVEEM